MRLATAILGIWLSCLFEPGLSVPDYPLGFWDSLSGYHDSVLADIHRADRALQSCDTNTETLKYSPDEQCRNLHAFQTGLPEILDVYSFRICLVLQERACQEERLYEELHFLLTLRRLIETITSIDQRWPWPANSRVYDQLVFINSTWTATEPPPTPPGASRCRACAAGDTWHAHYDHGHCEDLIRGHLAPYWPGQRRLFAQNYLSYSQRWRLAIVDVSTTPGPPGPSFSWLVGISKVAKRLPRLLEQMASKRT